MMELGCKKGGSHLTTKCATTVVIDKKYLVHFVIFNRSRLTLNIKHIMHKKLIIYFYYRNITERDYYTKQV